MASSPKLPKVANGKRKGRSVEAKKKVFTRKQRKEGRLMVLCSYRKGKEEKRKTSLALLGAVNGGASSQLFARTKKLRGKGMGYYANHAKKALKKNYTFEGE